MKTGVLLSFLLLALSLDAQPTTWNWVSGTQTGITWLSAAPAPFFPQFSMANGSVLSTKKEGNVLFIAGNQGIVNNTYLPLANSAPAYLHNLDYRSKLLLPHPSDNNLAWLYTVEPGSPFRLVRYTVSTAGGGSILPGPLVVRDSIGPTFEVIRMNREKDFWILAHIDSTTRFIAYRYREGTLTDSSVTTIGDSARYRVIKSNLSGGIVFLGKENTDSILPPPNNFTLTSFDTSTGSLVISFAAQVPVQPYSAAFAPDSAFLYLLHAGQPGALPLLRQYRFTQTNPLQSPFTIWEGKEPQLHPLGMLQLGPDHCIYITNPNHNAIAQIPCPNLGGLNAGYDSLLFSYQPSATSIVGVGLSFVPDPQKSLPVILPDTLPMCQEPPLIPIQGSWDSVAWTDSSGASIGQPEEPGKYYITVTRNCNTYLDSVVIIRIESTPDPVIPNVFTPNGDGNNDQFEIPLPGPLSGYQLSIYSRWGSLVFRSNNPAEKWEGQAGISAHSEGVYFVVLDYLDCQGKPRKKSKSLHLFRP